MTAKFWHLACMKEVRLQMTPNLFCHSHLKHHCTFCGSFPGIDRHTFVSSIPETNWSESTVSRAADLLLQLPQLLLRWARGGGGDILIASRTCCNSLWQHLKGLPLISRRLGVDGGGGREWGGWCNQAEIAVLTSQSVRVSENETSDRLRRCWRCQKHQKGSDTHTRIPSAACWTCWF